ncbi:MAG: methyltransferase domain-containing protein [Patescibacteria group bacterium]
MDLKNLQKNWDQFAQTDPLWASLTSPDKKGNKWQIEKFFKSGEVEIRSIIDYVKSLGVSLSRTRALDFGCGPGRLTEALADYFDEVHGVDIAPGMIEFANSHSKHKSRCKYHVNNDDNLKIFPDNFFDLIYSNITLQHMEVRYSKRYIKEFTRIISPGGLIIFQLPSRPRKTLIKLIKSLLPDYLVNLYYGMKHGQRPRMEAYGIKYEELKEFVEKNGATLIDAKQNQAAGKNWISYQYCFRKR